MCICYRYVILIRARRYEFERLDIVERAWFKTKVLINTSKVKAYKRRRCIYMHIWWTFFSLYFFIYSLTHIIIVHPPPTHNFLFHLKHHFKLFDWSTYTKGTIFDCMFHSWRVLFFSSQTKSEVLLIKKHTFTLPAFRMLYVEKF